MSIAFTCPHCGKQTEVADKFAGQSGPCGSCGQTIAIPGTAPPPNAAVPPVPDAAGSGTLITIGLICLAVVLVCGGVGVALLLPSFSTPRSVAGRMQCQGHLKQIALAFHNYHDVYGTFPPAYIPDEDGRPMHSWRVLILPFLEQQTLYEQYDFSQPWDSPTNLAVTNTPIPVYSCPNSPNANSIETHYMLITGPGTVFDGAKASTIADITDGTSNTLLCVEVQSHGVHWADPTDLDASMLAFPPINGGPGNAGGPHPGGLNAALCDGSVRFLPNSTSPQEFQSLITRGGDEMMPSFIK